MARQQGRKGAGDLRNRVQLQSATVVTDALGGRSQTWSTYATVWAAVEPQIGIVGSQKAEVVTMVSMRYRDGVEAEQRAIIDGVTYTVLAVINVENRNRDLVLHCMELNQ